MADVGFTRFDLGVPPMLVPVPKADYLQPHAIGMPQREDGTDTFGQYMNGGITAGQVLHFLAAHYVVGDPEPADKILRAMLQRQGRGEFQNGVRDAGGQGIDWTTWDGKPSGYEGYLADSFRFLQAVLLREASFRERLYRPLARPANAVKHFRSRIRENSGVTGGIRSLTTSATNVPAVLPVPKNASQRCRPAGQGK
jgi:hypothetical protein